MKNKKSTLLNIAFAIIILILVILLVNKPVESNSRCVPAIPECGGSRMSPNTNQLSCELYYPTCSWNGSVCVDNGQCSLIRDQFLCEDKYGATNGCLWEVKQDDVGELS